MDVAGLMHTWTKRMGHPYLKVTHPHRTTAPTHYHRPGPARPGLASWTLLVARG